MAPSPRIAAARLRARRAKGAVGATAVAIFAVVGIVARAAHPGASAAGGAAQTNSSSLPSGFQTFNESTDDDFGAGSIGPTVATPSTSTGTS